MEVVASLSEGRTAAAQCGLFTHKSVPLIFEPPCRCISRLCVFVCVCVRECRFRIPSLIYFFFSPYNADDIRFVNRKRMLPERVFFKLFLSICDVF